MGGIIEETGNQWYTFGHVRLGILIRNQSGDVNQPDEHKGLKFRLGRWTWRLNYASPLYG